METILPNEILDLFVDHLQDDKPTLLVCRIVCSRWLIRVRRWLSLHAVISIQDIYKERGRARNPKLINSTLKLIDLLQSPHVTIQFSIQKLTVMGLDEVPCSCCDLPIFPCDKVAYPALNLSLETCLPFLTHVSQLYLQEFALEYLSTKALALLRALPQVSHLDCYVVTFRSFTDMFELYSNLVELEVNCVELGMYQNSVELEVDGVLVNDHHRTAASEPLKLLTSLSLRVTMTSLKILSSKYIRLEGISSLKLICGDSEYFNDIPCFIAAAGPGLEHFHFLVSSAFIDAPINLAHNTNLKTLTLETYNLSSADVWMETLITSAHRNAQVEIRVWFSQEEVVNQDLSSLEDFIHGLGRDVVLKFIARKRGDGAALPLDFEDTMRSKLSKISNQGLLRFDFDSMDRNEDGDSHEDEDGTFCTDDEDYDSDASTCSRWEQ